MPTPELMGWNEKAKRWFKKYKGKPYAVSPRQLGMPETKEGSRKAANQWWECKQHELDANRLAPFKAHAAGSKVIGGAFPQLETIAALGVDRATALRIALALAPKAESERHSIAQHVARFVAEKLSEAKAGEITLARHQALENQLGIFATWFEAQGKPEVDEAIIADYRGSLLDSIAAEEFTHSTGKHRLEAVKMFARWLWKNRIIPELPRNLDLTITVPTKPPKVMPLEIFQTMYADTVERTRLFMLLMANCGMTQKDISDLLPSEYTGTHIVRKRSKTQSFESVPQVSYLLWPETKALLDKFRATKGERLLLNENGQPLLRDILVKGKRRHEDNIKQALKRLQKKTNSNYSPITIKKLSASKLRDSQYADCYDLFLGHAPRKMGDKHYAATPQQRLGEALTWLRGQIMPGKK